MTRPTREQIEAARECVSEYKPIVNGPAMQAALDVLLSATASPTDEELVAEARRIVPAVAKHDVFGAALTDLFCRGYRAGARREGAR